MGGADAGYGGRTVTASEWLPRLPLGLYACARAALIPGAAGVACSERLEWPSLAWLERSRAQRVLAAARAPVQ